MRRMEKSILTNVLITIFVMKVLNEIHMLHFRHETSNPRVQ